MAWRSSGTDNTEMVDKLKREFFLVPRCTPAAFLLHRWCMRLLFGRWRCRRHCCRLQNAVHATMVHLRHMICMQPHATEDSLFVCARCIRMHQKHRSSGDITHTDINGHRMHASDVQRRASSSSAARARRGIGPLHSHENPILACQRLLAMHAEEGQVAIWRMIPKRFCFFCSI